MASQLLSVNVEFLHQYSTRVIHDLSFYSPSTIQNLRSSLSENLSIPSNHFHFLRNGQVVNDQFRLIDQHTYQVFLQQPTTTTNSPSIFIAFFYHQSIHLLDVSSKKLKKTVIIGINTPIETTKEDINQMFKFLSIAVL